jgi:hypothetical protein
MGEKLSIKLQLREFLSLAKETVQVSSLVGAHEKPHHQMEAPKGCFLAMAFSFAFYVERSGRGRESSTTPLLWDMGSTPETELGFMYSTRGRAFYTKDRLHAYLWRCLVNDVISFVKLCNCPSSTPRPRVYICRCKFIIPSLHSTMKIV